MYFQKENIGMILGLNSKKMKGRRKNSHKALLIWLLTLNFKVLFVSKYVSNRILASQKKFIVKKNQAKSDKLQMEDILIPDAQLNAFLIEENSPTTKFFDEIKVKQDEVLKLKEVNEERLRMVVQL